jgi:tetratricopeptide (TPR) repeat protein
MMRRDFAVAEDLFRRSLQMRRELAGTDLQVARTINNLAKCIREQDRFGEAERYYRESADIFQRLYGSDSMRTAKVLGSLGGCLVDAGRFDDAEPLLLESLHTKEKFAGPDDASTARTVFDLARLFFLRSPPDLDRARKLAERALNIRRQRFQSGNREIAESESLLAEIVASGERSDSTPP